VEKRRDAKASAIIGLNLGSEQLEHVSGCKTTAKMCLTLQGVCHRKSLMNKMKARREFYTVAMNVGEGMLGYINRVRNLGENPKAMGSALPEMHIAMSDLNGLTSEYENLLVAFKSHRTRAPPPARPTCGSLSTVTVLWSDHALHVWLFLVRVSASCSAERGRGGAGGCGVVPCVCVCFTCWVALDRPSSRFVHLDEQTRFR